MMVPAALVSMWTATAVAARCANDFDCSLLGVCDVEGGACRCDPGWTGSDCAAASFKPIDLTAGYENKSTASWGGRAMQSADPATPDTWHLFASLFANKCPLAYWTHNSYVARLTSTTGALGPYVPVTAYCTPSRGSPYERCCSAVCTPPVGLDKVRIFNWRRSSYDISQRIAPIIFLFL